MLSNDIGFMDLGLPSLRSVSSTNQVFQLGMMVIHCERLSTVPSIDLTICCHPEKKNPEMRKD